MKAIVYHKYGSPDVLNLEEVQQPAPKENSEKYEDKTPQPYESRNGSKYRRLVAPG